MKAAHSTQCGTLSLRAAARRRLVMGCIAVVGFGALSGVSAHVDTPPPASAKVGLPGAPSSASLAPVAARYQVTISRRDPSSKTLRSASETWYFQRSPQRVTLIRGDIEEHWMRDDRGTVRFERVFHVDQRVVDYTAGELSTLGIDVSWDALATFIDARELALLKPAAASRGLRGAAAPQRFSGKSASRSVDVEWSAHAGLPARLTRVAPSGRVQFDLLESHANAPASWPVAGLRSADYLHVDSADFGDMEYDAFVRKAETFDVMAGWRKPHAHD